MSLKFIQGHTNNVMLDTASGISLPGLKPSLGNGYRFVVRTCITWGLQWWSPHWSICATTLCELQQPVIAIARLGSFMHENIVFYPDCFHWVPLVRFRESQTRVAITTKDLSVCTSSRGDGGLCACVWGQSGTHRKPAWWFQSSTIRCKSWAYQEQLDLQTCPNLLSCPTTNLIGAN